MTVHLTSDIQEPSTRLPVPPKSLTNLPSILSALSEIEALEASLSADLATLIASQQPIVDGLTRLQTLIPSIDELLVDAELLSEKVGGTAQTAIRVGGRVRTLDEEMRRVREASERVVAITDLKLSLADLYASIDAEDWETASRHCARAMAVPSDIIRGPFAESVVPTPDLPLPPSETLEQAREKLLLVFRSEFAKASKSRDSTSTSRFFKLFPSVGWEKEGLEVYAEFVVDLVRSRATISGKTSSPLYYVTTLTSLFESVALIVDQHQPVVEKYYGSGKMLLVVGRLLQECDRVVRGLIESWDEERQMKPKLQDTENVQFTTLVLTSSQQRKGTAYLPEEEGPDPREVDKVLTEMSSMAGRWALLRRFLLERLQEDAVPSDEGQVNPLTEPEGDPAPASFVEVHTENSQNVADDLIQSSGCGEMITQIVRSYYIPLETWYLRSVIDKAHRVSAPDNTEPPQTTTPDDVFYILKLVINRVLSTGSLDCVQPMMEAIRTILERDLAGVIRRKMDEIYTTSGAGSGRTGGTAAQRDKMERDHRQAFIIQLNDLDVASAYLDTLTKGVLSSGQISQSFLGSDVGPAHKEVASLGTLTARFQVTLKWGVEQLFNQLTRPKLRSLVADLYKDVTYLLEEDAYNAVEYQDPVKKRFIKAWEALTDGFKDAFTERNYRAFFSLAVDVLVRTWEKQVLSLKYSELGAIRFDKDLRSVTTYLAAQTVFGDTREKFLRMQQISTLLNLDLEEDPEEFYSSSGISWKLSQNEARLVASLRTS